MPHCLLEYSDNIFEKPDFKEVFKKIHDVLIRTGLFELADIKSRAQKHHDFFIGDGDVSRGFVTLNISILSGRSDTVKELISSGCLEILKNIFKDSSGQLKMSITVQITDMHKSSYQKYMSY